MLREDSIKTLAAGLMDAQNDGKLNSEGDYVKAIKRLTMTDAAKKKQADKIAKLEKKLADMKGETPSQ